MLFKKISKQEYFEAYCKPRVGKVNRSAFVQKFIDSGIPFAEVEWQGEYKSNRTCCSSLKAGVKLLGADHIKVISRGNDKVYIVNTLLAEKEEREETA